MLEQVTHRPSVLCFKHYFFFIISCRILCKNGSIYFFISLYKKIKSFECPKSIKNCEKNNAQNIRRLVCESFDPTTQQASVLYWRLSNFIMQWICDSKSTFYWVLKWSGHNSSEAKFLFYHFCFPISKYFYHHLSDFYSIGP